MPPSCYENKMSEENLTAPNTQDDFETIIDLILHSTEEIKAFENSVRGKTVFDVEPIKQFSAFANRLDGIEPDPFQEAADTMNRRAQETVDGQILEKHLKIFEAFETLRQKIEQQGHWGLTELPEEKLDILFEQILMNAIYEYGIAGYEDEMNSLLEAAGSSLCTKQRFMRCFEIKTQIFEESNDTFLALMQKVASFVPELQTTESEGTFKWEDPII